MFIKYTHLVRASATFARAAVLCAAVGLTPGLRPRTQPRAQTARPHAHDGGHAHANDAATRRKPVMTEIRIPTADTTLLNEKGERVRFYSDLVRGKTVVVGFFYTSCQFICAQQGRIFSRLQEKFGERLGRDVHLVLVSMDPATDTPQRLKQWGEKYGVRPGWTLVTAGEPEELNDILVAFTGDTAGRPEMHSSDIFIRGGGREKWLMVEGLMKPEDLAAAIDDIAREAGAAGGRR